MCTNKDACMCVRAGACKNAVRPKTTEKTSENALENDRKDQKKEENGPKNV